MLPRADGGEWERLKEAAKKEGVVVVSGPGFPGLRDALTEDFQKAHGIRLEYAALGGGEVATRVDSETKAGNVTIDVNIGGTSICWIMAERGQIDDPARWLVDPEVVKPDVWRGGAVRLIRPSPKMPPNSFCGVQTSLWVMTDLFVNRDVVAPTSIRSWQDLLKPEFKGKITSWDPRRPGSSQTTVGYLSTLFGDDYVRSLYQGQEVILTADYRQLAEWVARGTYPVGIGLVQANIEAFRREGLPLERVFPEDGPGALTGGFGTLHKINGGPHPNAGAVFMNWFASRDAQEMWEREMMETSLRTDVARKAPDYVLPKPGVDYKIDDYDPDYFFPHRLPAIEKLRALLER